MAVPSSTTISFAASIRNTANSYINSGSLVFLAFSRYNSSVRSCDNKAAWFPGRRWAAYQLKFAHAIVQITHIDQVKLRVERPPCSALGRSGIPTSPALQYTSKHFCLQFEVGLALTS